MSDYIPITTDMRLLIGCFTTKLTDFERDKFNHLCDVLDSIHAQLERENESLKAELDRARCEWDFWESTHVELPKDADGEYIHIGDMMECLFDGAKKVLRVEYMTYRSDGWHIALTIEEHYRYQSYAPNELRHAPTVEDVLTEFGIDWEHESDCEDRAALLKEYAAKLRLAGDE